MGRRWAPSLVIQDLTSDHDVLAPGLRCHGHCFFKGTFAPQLREFDEREINAPDNLDATVLQGSKSEVRLCAPKHVSERLETIAIDPDDDLERRGCRHIFAAISHIDDGNGVVVAMHADNMFEGVAELACETAMSNDH